MRPFRKKILAIIEKIKRPKKVISYFTNLIELEIKNGNPFYINLILLITLLPILLNLKWYFEIQIKEVVVEGFGLLMDIFFFGILINFFIKVREINNRIEEYQYQLQDYKDWKDPGATYRKAGIIRRLVQIKNDLTKKQWSIIRLFINEKKIIPPLEYMFLEGGDFSNLNLKNVNFHEAKLTKANFRNSDLSNTNLDLAHIQNAIFDNAILFETDFLSAKLEKASFIGAHMQDTNFNSSIFDDTNFSKADLTKTIGLENNQLKLVRINNKTTLDERMKKIKEIKNQLNPSFSSSNLNKEGNSSKLKPQ
jgi:hypothetical protein